MDDFELPDDLKDDIEIIYSDGESDGAEGDDNNIEDMLDEVDLNGDDDDVQVVDLAKLTFTKHTQSVFSSDLSPDGKLAVTGGQDDAAYIWNTDTGDVVFECTGHKDSVTEVAFSHTGQYVATADMGGMIQVWDLPERKLTWCFEGDDLHWLKWHPQANVLVAGFQSGDVYVWQIPQGNTKVLPAPGCTPTTCGQLLPNGKQLLVSYVDGLLKLWDLKSATAVWQISHEPSIHSFDISADASVAVLTPGAQLVKMSDGRTVSTLLAGGETEIETALFESALGVVVTGGLSGRLCVWELGKQALRHEAQIECPVTVQKWGKNGKIFIGGTDGAIYVCDVKLGTLLETLTGHKTEILSVSVFPDGTKILTTSDDGSAKIFDVKA